MNYYIIKLTSHHLLDQIRADFPEDELPFSYDPEDEDMNFVPHNVWKKSVTSVIEKIEKDLKEKSSAFFVVDIDKEKLLLMAALVKTVKEDKKEITKYLKESKLPGTVEAINVLCLKDVKDYLNKAEGSPLYRNSGPYKKQTNLTFLNQLTSIGGQDSLKQLVSNNKGFYVMEGLLNQSDKRYDWFLLGCHLGDRNYLNEMKRLHSQKTRETKFMVPVHYLFQVRKSQERDQSIVALSTKLYQIGRIHNPRLTVLTIANEKFDLLKLEAIFESAKAGCLVLEFMGAGKDLSEENFMEIYGLIRQYRHKVITILCFNDLNEEKIVFQKILADLPWIIFDGKMKYNLGEANVILKELAKRDEFSEQEAPKVQELLSEKTIKRDELERLYNQWYQKKALEVYDCYQNNEQSPAVSYFQGRAKKSAKEELEEMIGLTKAKEILKRLLLKQRFDKEFGERLKTNKKTSRHMIFMGNPGTAKTTVARLFARCLYEEGILKTEKIVECGRADLIGEYVGWTAKSVVKKFQEARGSILFIDEAYSLCDEKRGGFADEAINTLVQEMENHRDDVIVIFAGYKDEMKEFIKRNPGLSSRIPNVLEFEDYTPKELVEIAKLCAQENGRIIEEKAQENLLKKLSQMTENSLSGNGRYIRNVVELAIDEQVKRILSLAKEDVTDTLLETLKSSDFAKMDKLNEDNLSFRERRKTKEIGFRICAS